MTLARNALFVYTRTIVNLVVGVFSVRIMLEALGVEDYGLLNVAGASLGIFTIVLQSLGTSSSRFITYELGRGEGSRPRAMFCTAFTVFAFVGALIWIVGETVGSWIILPNLNIPEGREGVASLIYHLSVFGAVLAVLQTPFNAVLVARERFDFTASVSLAMTFLRLGLLIALCYSPGDHLVVYVLAMTVLSVLSLGVTMGYAMKCFAEVRPALSFDRGMLKSILKFSVWETLDAGNEMLRLAAFSVLINMLYGVAVNTAMGIALTVSGAVSGLAYSMNSVFKPRIVKLFASGSVEGMKNRALRSTLISGLLYGVFGIPLIVNLYYVMSLWLGEIPASAYGMCLAQLVINLPVMGFLVPQETLKSMGLNKWVNILGACVTVVFFGGVYLSGQMGWPAVVSFAIFQCMLLPKLVMANVLLARRLGGRFVRTLLDRAVLRVLLVEGLVFAALWGVKLLIDHDLAALAVTSVLSVLMFGAAGMLWLFPPDVREAVRGMVWEKLGKLRLNKSTSAI